MVEQIRTNPTTVMTPVLVLPETITDEAAVRRLMVIPRVILCNSYIAQSEEFAVRVRAVLAGEDILPPDTGALVKKAVCYLNRNSGSPISRWKLADSVHVSEDYLTRIFHKETGLSPWEYLNRYRIYLASKMLLHTNATVYDVAEKFGRHCYVSHSLEYFKNGEHSPDTREKTFEGMAAQVQMNRDESSSAPGSCFYSYSCVDGTNEMENGVDFFTYMKNNKFQDKALTPCISWKEAPAQGKVTNLRVNNGVLEWDAVDNVRYAVYLLPEGSSHDGRLLKVASNLKAHLYYNRYELPAGSERCEAAVAIVDRYGNRYEPEWISLSNPSGIAETTDGGFRITVTGDVAVFSSEAVAVEAYDAAGKKLAEWGACSQVDLSGFSGVVLLRVDTGDGVVTHKTVAD